MSSTVALAKKLGIARLRKLDGSSSSNRNVEKKQKLKYLLVIDFESTCWSEKHNSPPSEIIEFPVVLLCLTTGKVVSEFHNYCMPVEQPRLSPFCTQLTGIKQATVESGIPLPTCLVLFKQWLEAVCKQYKIVVNGENLGNLDKENEVNLATCCTWSDWDLSVCLEFECKRKQIRKPPCLNSWVDIRAVYRSFYNRRPQGLNGALRELGLSFQGREHSGIEDARNTAMLVWRMVEGGCELDVTGTCGAVKDLTKDPQQSTAAARNKDEQSPGRSRWRNYKTAPHVIPTGRQTPPRQCKKLKVTLKSPNESCDNLMTPDTKTACVTPVMLKTVSKLNDSGYSSSPNPTTPGSSRLTTLLQKVRPHPNSTPPLCVCGRRARKRQVVKPGPNTDRIFWSCPLRGRNTRAGCSFFVWAGGD